MLLIMVAIKSMTCDQPVQEVGLGYNQLNSVCWSLWLLVKFS